MKGKRFKVFAVMLFSTVAVIMLTVSASADAGPKKSIYVTINYNGDETCYATLLTNEKIGFRYIKNNDKQVFDRFMTEHHGSPDHGIDEAIISAFEQYAETDELIFADWYTKLKKGKNVIRWGYRTPDTIKLVLYYPESGVFAASGGENEYAFDSYFTVSVNGSESGETLTLYCSYNYAWEAVKLIIRIALTLLIEVGIALLFKLREKRQIVTIIVVNLITQGILNIWLNLTLYFHSFTILTAMGYIIGELIVYFSETIAYWFLFRDSPRRKLTPLYAFIANLASFLIGTPLALVIEGIID